MAALAADDCGVPAGRLRAGLSAGLLVLDGDLQITPNSLRNPRAVMVRGLQIVDGLVRPLRYRHWHHPAQPIPDHSPCR